MRVRSKREKRNIRHKRVRARIKGTSKRPRLSVFRSNRWLMCQLIDDRQGKTLASASSREFVKKNKGEKRAGGRVGELIAGRALEKNINQAVFDRGGYKYHGAVEAIAKGARKAGLKI